MNRNNVGLVLDKGKAVYSENGISYFYFCTICVKSVTVDKFCDKLNTQGDT
jgi:hypothetical protein